MMTVQQSGFPPVAVAAVPPPKPVEKIEIKDKIQFELGKANLKPVSLPILDHVVNVLVQRPGIRKLEIEGHTDVTGDPEKNRALSQARAQSVLEYLVKKGIAADRLSAKGWGPDKPVASNDTPDGREANRRVEFVIVDQD
jgi:outer membrane protein OmpA-like peptidoglycan-associated protein